MTPRLRSLFTVTLIPSALNALVACGSPPPPAMPAPASSAATTTEHQSPATGLAPRIDLHLHCTLSALDEEACAAIGSGHHLGPQRFHNGPALGSQDEIDRAQAEYDRQVESATVQCECLTDGLQVPFQ